MKRRNKWSLRTRLGTWHSAQPYHRQKAQRTRQSATRTHSSCNVHAHLLALPCDSESNWMCMSICSMMRLVFLAAMSNRGVRSFHYVDIVPRALPSYLQVSAPCVLHSNSLRVLQQRQPIVSLTPYSEERWCLVHGISWRRLTLLCGWRLHPGLVLQVVESLQRRLLPFAPLLLLWRYRRLEVRTWSPPSICTLERYSVSSRRTRYISCTALSFGLQPT